MLSAVFAHQSLSPEVIVQRLFKSNLLTPDVSIIRTADRSLAAYLLTGQYVKILPRQH